MSAPYVLDPVKPISTAERRKGVSLDILALDMHVVRMAHHKSPSLNILLMTILVVAIVQEFLFYFFGLFASRIYSIMSENDGFERQASIILFFIDFGLAILMIAIVHFISMIPLYLLGYLDNRSIFVPEKTVQSKNEDRSYQLDPPTLL